MKILVFDDNELHRKGAVNQLSKEHELTVVETYNEAEDALTPHVDESHAEQLLAEAGFSEMPNKKKDGDAYEERIRAYWDAEKKAQTDATVYPDFDIVLTDLLVLASSRTQGTEGERYVGEEMPLGTTIAFLAIKNGVKRIGVITDANHHAHPASAALDNLDGYQGNPFNIGDVQILFASNLVNWPANPDTAVLLTAEEEKALGGYNGYQNYPSVKNWQKAVQRLIGESE